ncbi:hypothetical protein LBMAG27_17670 [Bacteroidota bacterium]|nr:hypothetical protein LBMAG27_17670 [Bacteroidota bacterium]
MADFSKRAFREDINAISARTKAPLMQISKRTNNNSVSNFENIFNKNTQEKNELLKRIKPFKYSLKLILNNYLLREKKMAL